MHLLVAGFVADDGAGEAQQVGIAQVERFAQWHAPTLEAGFRQMANDAAGLDQRIEVAAVGGIAADGRGVAGEGGVATGHWIDRGFGAGSGLRDHAAEAF